MSPKVLVVCTANVCRSPMAGALLGSFAAREGVGLDVSTAGLLAHRRPVDPVAVAALADLGLDISDHRPRQVTSDVVVEADLVLAMTREHVRSLVAEFPGSFPRTFTVKELVRRLDPDGTFDIGSLHAGRSAAELLGESEADDIADPFGGPPAGYSRCVDDLHAALGAIVDSMRNGLR